MSKYITSDGDDFNRLSRRFYGDESNIDLLRDSNPGIEEPFQAGISLVIPDLDDSPGITQAEDEDEVQLFINGKLFRFWTSYKVTKNIDTFTVIEFSAPFNPDEIDHRNFFRPFMFQEVKVVIGSELQFIGNMLPPAPASDVDSVTVTVAVYSRSGVINDCNFSPKNLTKFSFNNVNLQEIANITCASLALTPVFIGDPGPVFEEVQLEPDENPFTFLADLAKQRNFVITDNEQGAPVFWRSIPEETPVAIFEGDSPQISIEPGFNGQGYYSHVTALSPADPGFNGSSYTVKNEKLGGVIRPLVFKAPDTEGSDTKTAAEAKISRMFANSVNYVITVHTWRDSNGDLFDVNKYVTVNSPKNMIYGRYNFLIKSVEMIKVDSGKTARLVLVLPGAYDGALPGRLPWEE